MNGIKLEADTQLDSITWVSRRGKVLGFIQTVNDGKTYDAGYLDSRGFTCVVGEDLTQDEAISALLP